VRVGQPALPVADALALFDAAVIGGEAHVVAARITQPAPDVPDLPALLRIPTTTQPTRATAQAADASALRERLAGVTSEQRGRALLELVRVHAAAVLGHGQPGQVDVDRGVLDLGFESMTALELRGRLATATGLRLAPMLLFDYPTLAAVAAHLQTELFGDDEPEQTGRDLSAATADELFELLDSDFGATHGRAR